MSNYVPNQTRALVQNLGNDYLVYGSAYHLRMSFMDGHRVVMDGLLHKQQVLPI